MLPKPSIGGPISFSGRRVSVRNGVISGLLCLLLLAFLVVAYPAAAPKTTDLQKMPLSFVPNQGQSSAEVKFQAHNLNGGVFLTGTDLVFSLAGKSQAEKPVVRITHEAARADAAVSGLDRLPGQMNYLIGNDPARWHTHVPTYATVMYQDLYPGIDLKYVGSEGVLESFYYVKPGADPAQIRIGSAGDGALGLNQATGELELSLAVSGKSRVVLTQQAPVAYQETEQGQVLVASQYVQNADHTYSIALGAYDTAHTLVIDPTLIYSSFFGGGSIDSAEGIERDGAGNIYITGWSDSNNFPSASTVPGGSKDGDDAFVIKLNPTGSSMIYGTYIGGSDDDEGTSIAVDTNGYATMVGSSDSVNFPTHNGYAATCRNPIFGMCVGDAILVRLSQDGSSLAYGTYLGGAGVDSAEGVAVDNGGQAYLVGATFSSDFPTRSAAQSALSGVSDAFVARIDMAATGSASLVWGTYLGGDSVEEGSAIALAGSQGLVITGETLSANFPTRNAIQATNKGSQDIFVASLTSAGAVQYSTFLGGTGKDTAYGITANADGAAFVTGNTTSKDFPVSSPLQTTNKGGASGSDAFVTGIDKTGTAWSFSTYLGGSGDDYGYDIAVNQAGAIYVAGSTQSSDFTLVNAFQGYGGNSDAFVAKLQPGGAQLAYTTYLGGSDADTASGIAVDNSGQAYVTGTTFSGNFPMKNALHSSYAGSGDTFISIISDAGDNPPVDQSPVPPTKVEIPAVIAHHPLIGSFKVASNISLAPGAGNKLTFTILLHNSSSSAVSASVVDKLPAALNYVSGSVTSSGAYDAGQRSLTWTGINVPAFGEVKLTFDVSTSVEKPTLVINTADITAKGETFHRSFGVLVGKPFTPPVDAARPVVDSVTIGSQDVLTSQNVTLHIQAHDNDAVKSMYINEWQINPLPAPHWELVKTSQWIDYQTDYAWTLGNKSGVHYIGVSVADKSRNVSIFDQHALDFASLLLPNMQLKAGRMIPYLVYLKANDTVKVRLTPSIGNADIYAWYPGNIVRPDQYSVQPGATAEQLNFTAPVTGRYLFMIFAVTDTTYTLQITPAGGPALAADAVELATVEQPAAEALLAGEVTLAGTEPLFTAEPLLSQIGFDPLASSTASIPVDDGNHTIYIPIIKK